MRGLLGEKLLEFGVGRYLVEARIKAGRTIIEPPGGDAVAQKLHARGNISLHRLVASEPVEHLGVVRRDSDLRLIARQTFLDEPTGGDEIACGKFQPGESRSATDCAVLLQPNSARISLPDF